jgi:phosphate starvation-inducible PhoH-like protein
LRPPTIDWFADLDNARLANLCGPLDENIRQIEAAFDVAIKRRGARFKIEGGGRGNTNNRDRAKAALDYFATMSGKALSAGDVQLGIVELKNAAARERKRVGSRTAPANDSQPTAANDDSGAVPSPGSAGLRTRRTDLHGRTPNQRAYLAAIASHDITFGIGPAGTGKTYLAVANAVDALERDAVQRIVLTRPAVEAGERLGFLPGDLAQKIDPYLRPLYDALYDLLGFDKTQKLFEKQAIEIAPLAYMRGRTLNNAFIILDEAQNTTPEQIKMFLTRIGFGSKAVITGDVTQIDLPKGAKSGLVEASLVLAKVRGIGFTHFTSVDVVRHPLVARIVEAYEAHYKPRASTKSRTKDGDDAS